PPRADDAWSHQRRAHGSLRSDPGIPTNARAGETTGSSDVRASAHCDRPARLGPMSPDSPLRIERTASRSFAAGAPNQLPLRETVVAGELRPPPPPGPPGAVPPPRPPPR